MAEVFTTERGVEVPLRHISPRPVAALMMKYAPPDAPTYTVEVAGGGTLEFEHDKTTLETAEDQAAWRAYEAERTRREFERQMQLQRFLIAHCIDADPPPVEEWAIDYALWDLEPPDASDAIEYKVRWVEEELCPSPREFTSLLLRLFAMSGVEEDRIRAIERFFRPIVEGAELG